MTFRYLLIHFIGAILLFSCNEPPTFISSNQFDPNSDGYKPNGIKNLSYQKLQGNSLMRITWEFSEGTGNIFTGFKISTSYSDTTSYNSVDYVYEAGRHNIFQHEDIVNPAIFNAIYKIETFYEKNKSDTSFSDPIYLEIPINLTYYIEPTIYPFVEQPFLDLNWNIEEFDGISIQFFEETGNGLTLMEQQEIESRYGDLSIPLENPLLPSYYFRLINMESSTNFIEITNFHSPFYYLDTRESLESSTLLSIRNDTAYTSDLYVAFDSILFSIWNAEIFQDSIFIFQSNQSTVNENRFSNSDSEFIIDQLDSSLPYVIGSSLIKGSYTSDFRYFPFYYNQDNNSWVADSLKHANDVPLKNTFKYD